MVSFPHSSLIQSWLLTKAPLLTTSVLSSAKHGTQVPLTFLQTKLIKVTFSTGGSKLETPLKLHQWFSGSQEDQDVHLRLDCSMRMDHINSTPTVRPSSQTLTHGMRMPISFSLINQSEPGSLSSMHQVISIKPKTKLQTRWPSL